MSSSRQTLQDDEISRVASDSSAGFPPVSRYDAHVLILGSLPGQRSLQAAQYYAHPQNVFWRIMQELVGAEGSYQQRCDVLVEHESAEANDFAGFLAEHREIELICFNGQKAAKLFQHFVIPGGLATTRRHETLPSTSPAYASMPYAEKLNRWRSVIAGS